MNIKVIRYPKSDTWYIRHRKFYLRIDFKVLSAWTRKLSFIKGVDYGYLENDVTEYYDIETPFIDIFLDRRL